MACFLVRATIKKEAGIRNEDNHSCESKIDTYMSDNVPTLKGHIRENEDVSIVRQLEEQFSKVPENR